MNPRIIIPTGLGINSEEELGYVFSQAGARVDYRHVNELIERPELLDEYAGAGLPGGFSMGDQLGAGQSLANRIRHSGLRDKLAEKLDDPDFPIYAVCNFLQVLAKLDLLPCCIGTTRNDSGKHETGFWDCAVERQNDSVWLSYLRDHPGPIFAPISHGEGRIITDTDDIDGLVALRYHNGYIRDFFHSSDSRYNPNGSTGDIAGIGWANNLVLFPHFERLHHDFQRPDRATVKRYKGTTHMPYVPTRLLFQAAVEAMR